jgi:hypothetical protein
MSFELYFDTKFRDFLHTTRHLCKLSEILKYEHSLLLCEQGNFIKVENKDTITFIPKNKLHLAVDGFDNTKYRVPLKIGRFITKFLKKEARMLFYIQDSDIEIFVNLFKSYFDRDTSNFKVISGDEILHWYLESNYFQPNGCKHGTLWNSCMRYSHKNQFMKIYSENPDQIKMLINVDENGKLKTRALLWDNVTDEKGNSYKVMDRIYSVYDYEISSFKQWASDNGYIHKLEQSAKSELHFVTQNGVEILDLKIKLKNWRTMMYPYIDTFKFLDYNRGILSNSEKFYYDFILVQNDGSLERDEEILSTEDF